MKSPPSSATTAAAVWFGVAYDQSLFEKLSATTTMQVPGIPRARVWRERPGRVDRDALPDRDVSHIVLHAVAKVLCRILALVSFADADVALDIAPERAPAVIEDERSDRLVKTKMVGRQCVVMGRHGSVLGHGVHHELQSRTRLALMI